MKLAEILSGPETWCQGSLHTTDTQHCLMGALDELLRDEPREAVRLREWRRLAALLGRAGGAGQHILTWNDDPRRTWEDVAAVVEAFDRDRLLNP